MIRLKLPKQKLTKRYKMSKTKKKKNIVTRFVKKTWSILKAIHKARAKIFYIVVGLAELGAVGTLAIVKGDTAPAIAKVTAVPLLVDFFIRLATIAKPFLKSE